MSWLGRLFTPATPPPTQAEQRAEKAVRRSDQAVDELRSVVERLDALVGRLEEREDRWTTGEPPT